MPTTAKTEKEPDEVVSRLSSPLPIGTIDSHMHIIPPDFERFPLQASAHYRPPPYTLADATKFYRTQSGLGISTPRCVLTQVSIYGNDNSALLSGVTELANNARGVVQCDPESVSVAQLESWWRDGARGIRINLVSVGQSINESDMQALLQSYVNKLTQMAMPSHDKKWVIEMFMSLPSMPMLHRVLPKIDNGKKVRWCLDHFGGLKFKDDAPAFGPKDDAYIIHGFGELVELITNPALPEVYLKISGQYRVDPEYPRPDALGRLNVVGRELVSKAEDRVIWASDWPHTRFENIDSLPFVELCYSWCEARGAGQVVKDKLFRTNSERLWDMA